VPASLYRYIVVHKLRSYIYKYILGLSDTYTFYTHILYTIYYTLYSITTVERITPQRWRRRIKLYYVPSSKSNRKEKRKKKYL